VPYREQQFHALMLSEGVLAVDESTLAALALDIRSHL
jgi:hypothetical protein